MSTYKQDNMTIHNADCMDIMAGYEDNYFDLAVVDPPYGINVQAVNCASNRSDKRSRIKTKWDNSTPDYLYFQELKRVSREQIIWGANYFNCFSGKMGAIIWNKLQPLPDSSQCEIASYSRLQKVGLYEQRWTNFVNTKGSNHPTEKPIDLYNWIFANYAEEGQKILDTHLGSGSNAIAAHYAKMHFIGCELDLDYYKASVERIRKETRQQEFNF